MSMQIRAIRSFRAIQEEAKKRFPAPRLQDPARRRALEDFILERVMLIEDADLRIYALEEARHVLL